MIILDTNVVSELLRPRPEPMVEAWLGAQDGGQVYLTATSEAELRYGMAILPNGKRRDELAEAVEGMPREDFCGRILPFDSAAAEAYAAIAAERRTAGTGNQSVRLPDRRRQPRPRGDRRDQKRQGF